MGTGHTSGHGANIMSPLRSLQSHKNSWLKAQFIVALSCVRAQVQAALSVCLSVTSQYHAKTNPYRITGFSPPGRPGTVVFLIPTLIHEIMWLQAILGWIKTEIFGQ